MPHQTQQQNKQNQLQQWGHVEFANCVLNTRSETKFAEPTLVIGFSGLLHCCFLKRDSLQEWLQAVHNNLVAMPPKPWKHSICTKFSLQHIKESVLVRLLPLSLSFLVFLSAPSLRAEGTWAMTKEEFSKHPGASESELISPLDASLFTYNWGIFAYSLSFLTYGWGTVSKKDRIQFLDGAGRK